MLVVSVISIIRMKMTAWLLDTNSIHTAMYGLILGLVVPVFIQVGRFDNLGGIPDMAVIMVPAIRLIEVFCRSPFCCLFVRCRQDQSFII